MSAAAVLKIIRDGEAVKSQAVEGEVLLGRAEKCLIRLEDRAISREHAAFRAVEGGVQVEKRSEFAPLRVNGADCTRAVIKEGDVIEIGPYLVRLEGAKKPAVRQAAGPELSLSVESPESPVTPEPAGLEMPADLSADPFSSPEPQDGPLEMDAPALGGLDVSGLESPGLDASQDPSPDFTPESSPESSPDFSPDQAMALDQPLAFDGAPSLEVGDGGMALDTSSLDFSNVEMASDQDKTKVVAPEKLKAMLLLPPGVAEIEELEINSDIVSIGRGDDCDIVLHTKKASRRHAEIRRSGLSFTIRDLDTVNGTYVNGEKVQERELSGDDVIRIGGVELKFRAMSSDYISQKSKFVSPVEDASDSLPSLQDMLPSVEGAGSPQDFVSPLELPQEVPLAPLSGSSPAPATGPSDLFASPAVGLSANQLSIPQGPGHMNPGMGAGGIPGIPGMGGPQPKQSFLDRFGTKQSRIRFLALIVLGFLAWDEMSPQPEKAPASATSAAQRKQSSEEKKPGIPTFERLTADQKRFVEEQYRLGLDYFKNREYDKSLFEIERIFTLIPDYKDSKEIQRYAQEGKRKLEALEEEKRRKEEEERLRAKVARLLADADARMRSRKFEQARELFYDILAIEPENQQVAQWKKTIEDIEEEKRLREQQKRVQSEINKRAWEMFDSAKGLKESGKLYEAIAGFEKIADLGASDKEVLQQSNTMIEEARNQIRDTRDPVLAEARQLEESGDLPAAYKRFEKATEIDPRHQDGFEGMKRIREHLRARARVVYTEAVMAESYSDFETAKQKFKECLEISPKDDIYYERAQRKLAGYYRYGKDEQ